MNHDHTEIGHAYDRGSSDQNKHRAIAMDHAHTHNDRVNNERDYDANTSSPSRNNSLSNDETGIEALVRSAARTLMNISARDRDASMKFAAVGPVISGTALPSFSTFTSAAPQYEPISAGAGPAISEPQHVDGCDARSPTSVKRRGDVDMTDVDASGSGDAEPITRAASGLAAVKGVQWRAANTSTVGAAGAVASKRKRAMSL